MTPSSFSAVILRFLGVVGVVYGIVTLIGGLLGQIALSNQVDDFERAMNGHGESEAAVNLVRETTGQMIFQVYGIGGCVVLVGALVVFFSRSLGALIGRGLE